MEQFNVYSNPNRDTQKISPYLLDIQSDLIGSLDTRVVAPLQPLADTGEMPIETLAPVLQVAGRRYVMVTPQLAGIPRSGLSVSVDNLASCGDKIIAALDLLITGI